MELQIVVFLAIFNENQQYFALQYVLYTYLSENQTYFIKIFIKFFEQKTAPVSKGGCVTRNDAHLYLIRPDKIRRRRLLS